MIHDTFYNHGTNEELLTIHRAGRLVGIPAHFISDAINTGKLPVREVSGCKAVTLADLLKMGCPKSVQRRAK